MSIFKNSLISFFSIIFFTQSIFSATAADFRFPTEGTPQKKAPLKSAFTDDDPAEDPQDRMDAEERRLSVDELIEIIEKQELPLRITSNCFHRSILQLEKKERDFFAKYCLDRQFLQVKELTLLDLKRRFKENEDNFSQEKDEHYSKNESLMATHESLKQRQQVCEGLVGALPQCCAILQEQHQAHHKLLQEEKRHREAVAIYSQTRIELQAQLAPYRLSFVEWHSCLAIIELKKNGLGISVQEILLPILLKIQLLPIARMQIMFYQELHTKTLHPWVAEAALNYFKERHESEITRKVQPEDIAFVIDIFKYNQNLRDEARMVAKIFARIGAISPVNLFYLYFGNAHSPRRSLSGLPTIESGLVQLADRHKELNDVINDFFRNHVSSIIERHHFGEEAAKDIEKVLVFFKDKCESVPSTPGVDKVRIANYRKLTNLLVFMRKYNSLRFSSSIYEAYRQDTTIDPLNAINESIMQEGDYNRSDLLTLCAAAEGLHPDTKTALLTYLEFVSSCFPSKVSSVAAFASTGETPVVEEKQSMD